ncbi:GntR family transcriptional regulator [Actinomadura sp. 21ATH]|uniref:GntR family transcriptional regulator n=1 Tax=Actinomadura sp. 21ATH TaxID=1735444 RepID=UPI0035C0D3AA
MTVDLEGPEPIYRQIAAVITQRIDDGTYPPRRAIPSAAALCEEFGVSRKTVRAATNLLIEQGRLVGVVGRGVFVVGSEPPAGS